MAPIDDSTAAELRSLVKKLEMRVQELESKLSGDNGSANPLSSMRMVIMGPPGAGWLLHNPSYAHMLTSRQVREHRRRA